MYEKEYKKLCREMNNNLVGLKVKTSDYIDRVYEKYNISRCNGIIVKNKSGRKYGIEIYGKKNNASSYGVFWLDPLQFDVIKEEREDNTMAKLTGYNKVAVIKTGCGTYHFAIYEDGFDYQPGDAVYVSGQSYHVLVIDEIISPEETAQRYNKNITAEVICKIDTSAYDERVNKRKMTDEVKKKMDVMIKKMDETNKYEMYAAQNPELKGLLDSYKELVG